jgi:hypothetical protein
MHTQRDVQFDPSSTGGDTALGGSVGGPYGIASGSGFPGGPSAGWGQYSGSMGQLVNSLGPPPGSVNTGNEFNMGVPQFAPSQWGTFDMPIMNPTIGFNNQPYVENFNAGFPTQMNPAYNIDNITTPTVSTFGGYPNQIGGYAYPGNLGWSVNPFGSMFGGTGGGREGSGGRD